MLPVAIALFVLAALAGATLVFCHFRFRTLPTKVVVSHGVVGAVGLVLLTAAVVRGDGGERAKVALVVLAVAALGGFANLALNLRQARLHMPMVVLHALVAATGLAILIAAWWW